MVGTRLASSAFGCIFMRSLYLEPCDLQVPVPNVLGVTMSKASAVWWPAWAMQNSAFSAVP